MSTGSGRSARARIALLIGLLSLGVLLSGCPGMPGAPGGREQNMPPGMLPPYGLESGGARTLMGTTITAPENSALLVRHLGPTAEGEPPWRSCRRIIVLNDSVLIEGINYDRRDKDAERDVNQVIPFTDIEGFDWKYEPRETSSDEEESGSKEADSKQEE